MMANKETVSKSRTKLIDQARDLRARYGSASDILQMRCALKKCRKLKRFARIIANFGLRKAEKYTKKKPSTIYIVNNNKNAEG